MTDPAPVLMSHATPVSKGSAVLTAIVLLQIYQGYTLSIAGVASPWIAASFRLDQPGLARLFAWMSASAAGSLVLARMADRVGRRKIILTSLLLVPIFSAGAALSPNAVVFALFEIRISALLGGSVSSAIVLSLKTYRLTDARADRPQPRLPVQWAEYSRIR